MGHEDRDRLQDLRADPDFFGIAAVPRHGESLKSIDVTLAGVLSELRSPAQLPERAGSHLLADGGKPLLRLLLDDFLQVDTGDGFIGGPATLELLPSLRDVSSSLGALASLTDHALRHAATVRVHGVEQTAERLYSYNTAPETPRLRATFDSASSVARAFKLVGRTRLAHAIAERWHGPPRFADDTWWSFDTHTASVPNERLRYKVYLSPRIDVLARAIDVAIPILGLHRCPAFKLGGTMHQLLRPDKFVAYFVDRAQMQDAASALANAMMALPSQGVPFSAAVGDGTIVSWGIDPPADSRPLSWQERDSWRTWVTRRLARYLVIARHYSTARVKPWEFARVRLQLDGVDTDRWAPSAVPWETPQWRTEMRMT